MANRFPLIVNTTSGNSVQELPSGDFLDLSNSGISNSGNISVSGIISATGNITGNYILGNGSQLGGIITSVANINLGTSNVTVVSSGGNVTVGIGGTSNVVQFATTGVYVTGIVSATGNITGGNLSGTNLTGTLATAAQTNITSVGTLGALTVTANTTSGNLLTGGLISATGNVTGGNVSGTNLTGTVTTASQPNITSVGTLGSLSVTGNVTAGNVSGTNLTGTLATTAQTNITSVGTLDSLSVTGNVQGGNLRTAGLISATGAITVGGDISLTGNIVDTAAMTISTSGNGNITLSPNGTGVIVVNKDIQNGQGNGIGNIGSATTYFNTVFAKATSAQYADLAENYEADAEYAPGTIVVFGGDKEVTISNKNHDTAVAGIISTNPSYLMNAGQTGKWVLPVALTGRVPCRVQGPVSKGAVLVTGDIPGTAMAIKTSKFVPGCVVGKSLEIINSTDVVTIEVAVGRL